MHLPAAQDCGHDARIPVAVHHGNHPQLLLIRRTGNQVIPDADKALRTFSEPGAAVAVMGKWNQATYGVKDLVNHAVGGLGAVLPEIGRYLIEIIERL